MKKSSPSLSPPSKCYRLGKRNQKYVVIHNHVKSTPRTHNYRRKVQVAKQKVINHYKNKASQGVGRESSLSEPTNPNTRRSLKFMGRLYRKMHQNKKAVHPAPMVRYEESWREEIRFDETDADWGVLNEFIAIAKQEAVELELMVTKEKEDEDETPSDKFDPVKAAHDFLAVNGIAAETSVDRVEQVQSQHYRRPVHPATLTTGLCYIVAFIGASNIKSKRRIKNMRRRMFLNIKIRPQRSRLAITSYYTAKVEDILSKYMYNQRLRVQSALKERVRSDGETGGDDTLDTLSSTSSSPNTEDSNDDIDALDSKVSSSGYDDDSKKKTAPNQEEHAAPTTTNVDLSIPGAFTQYSHCNSKRCCIDAGCSSVGHTKRGTNGCQAESTKQVNTMLGGGRQGSVKSSEEALAAKRRKADLQRARRQKRSLVKLTQDRENDKVRKKTPEAREKGRAYKKTPEAREKGRAYKKTPEAREKGRAYKKTPEAREKGRAYKKKSRANRNLSEETRDKIEKRARMKRPHVRENNRSRKNNPKTRKENLQRMRNTRARAKKLRLDKSCSFDNTKVWEKPGKHYVHENFEDSPEKSAQLWYDNNGTWRERELKWLIGYLHLDDMLSKSKDSQDADKDGEGSDSIIGPQPVLEELLRTSIRCNRALDEAVYLLFDKDDWFAQRKWQDKNSISDSQLAALSWIDIPESAIDAQDIQDAVCPLDLTSDTPKVNESWATGLIGMKLQVPEYWWVDDDTKEHFKGTKRWKCEIASIKLDEEKKRYFSLKCLNDPDDPSRKKRYPMAYEDVLDYADEKDPMYSTFDLPDFLKRIPLTSTGSMSFFLIKQKSRWSQRKIIPNLKASFEDTALIELCRFKSTRSLLRRNSTS